MLVQLEGSEANLQQTFERAQCQIQELEAKCQGSAQKLLQVRLCAEAGREGR
jgi:hypothetical protein